MTAVVLVGMSVTDVDRRDALQAAADELGGTVAFLQMADPSLAGQLTRLADEGCTRIVLLGVDTGPLGPGHSWLRRIAGHWWRERAGTRPVIEVVTEPAGSLADPGSLAALLDHTRPITGDEPGLTSSAWEDVTGHRHQVLVCRGPRCTAKGADDNLRSMVLAMLRQRLGDDDVLLVHTGCQVPCNQAPVISVQPDDVWYGKVDPRTAERIVAEHLAAAEPVESHRLARRAPMAAEPESR